MIAAVPSPEGDPQERRVQSKSELPFARVALVRLMQSINFGSIMGLPIKDRQPVLDPPPRILREVKFGGQNGPRPEIAIDDFFLKSQVVEFLAYLDQIENGVIAVIVIKHGLPFQMTLETVA